MPSEFQTIQAVVSYLKAEGWIISQTTFWRHQKSGRIRPDKGGAYSKKTVDKYAKVHLQEVGTRKKIDETNLAQQKLIADIANKTLSAQRRQFEFEILKSEYFPKADFHLELASRAATLEVNFKFHVQTRAAEIIEAVDGDIGKEMVCVQLLNGIIDEILNEFATTKEFFVVFQGKPVEKESKKEKGGKKSKQSSTKKPNNRKK